MADMFAVYVINVEDMEQFDSVKEKIMAFSPRELKEEEVGFGIKKLKVMFTLSDKEGLGDLEKKLESIEGVSSIDNESVGRL